MVSTNSQTRSETLAAMRVLDALDGSEQSRHWHCTPQRDDERRPLRQLISIFIPTNGTEEAGHAVLLSAWSRNVSDNGMSLIHRGEIPRTDFVVELDGDLILSTVAWSRLVQEGWHEYGVVFRHRLLERGQRDDLP